MPAKKAEGEKKVHLVVGGCGFLGRYIVEQLLERGETVRVFDKFLNKFQENKITFTQGDILSESDLKPAMTGVTTVYNTVSPPHGMTYKQYYAVNVTGTETLLKVARECGVKQFIHTSSSSVVFCGYDLKGVDETQSFPKKHIDPYSQTKEIAEKVVLSENGKDGMMTVALRPSAIFGPRDRQFFPGTIQAAKDGKWKYQIGDGQNLQDFTYVVNVAHAHLLAADKLTVGSPIGGQAYFITNGEPEKPWKLISTIYEKMGYGTPYIKLPLAIMWYFSMLIDIVVWILSLVGIKLHPNFTFFRIATISANRYFNIDKARRDLAYKPLVPLWDGMETTIKWFREQENNAKK